MESVKQRFTDLGTVIDGIHSLFDQLQPDELHPALDETAILQAKLAVHEWTANLVQHADFGGRIPQIVVDVWTESDQIRCTVEDNSNGFDLEGQLMEKRNGLPSVPERGMGLLMLEACTSDLRYEKTEGGHCRLQFIVNAGQDPCLNIPFS
ncbi:MAG: ATP-binding protein [Rhodothermales bacterium]|nr:ATP-binding protein [Rhodothermales bacterium]